MRFRGNARLDPTEAEAARGGDGRVSIPLLGGAILALIALTLLFLFVTGAGGCGGSNHSGVSGASDLSANCKTGTAAQQSADCDIVPVVDSVQAFWGSELPTLGTQYVQAPTVLYTDAITTGCGLAAAEGGPFYCPADKKVYLDLSFFQDLHSQYGATGGTAGEAYVIAHEYGHHVQDLLGVFNRIGTPTHGAAGSSVRLELQADCYAGVWMHHATESDIIADVSPSDISDALNAVSAVGNDRLQRAETGSVRTDTFTHGTPAQRDNWFSRGAANGNPADCDTFTAASL